MTRLYHHPLKLLLLVLMISFTSMSVAKTESTINITAVSKKCKNDSAFTIQVNQTSGYFYGGTYIDSFGQFTPSLTSQRLNKVYYTMQSGSAWIKDSITVTVDSIPDASITPVGSYCQNSPLAVLTGKTNKNGKFKQEKYLSTVGVFYPSIALKGTHRVFYTVTDGNGCKNTDSLDVVVDSLPNASILDPGELCHNTGANQLQPMLSGGTFKVAPYITNKGIFDTEKSDTGEHKVVYTITDGNGCTRSDSINIRVNSIVDAGINSAGPFCINNGIQKLSATTSTNGYFSQQQYLDTNGNFIPNVAGQGNHTVYYNSRSDKGCIATDSLIIKVNDLPDASIDHKPNYCKNDLDQSLSGLVNTNGNFTVTPFLNSLGSLDLSKAVLGVHTVHYTVTDANGCTNSDSATIIVDSIPNASILSVGPYCESSSPVQLVPNINAGNFITTSYITNSGLFSPRIAGEGDHKVYHTFTDGNGCSNTDSLSINIYTKPDASLQNVSDLCLNGGIQQLLPVNNTSGKFIQTSYLDSNGFFDPAKAQVGTHKVYYTVTDANNCSNTDSSEVNVILLPDASITPVSPLCTSDNNIVLSGLNNKGGSFESSTFVTVTGIFNPSLANVGSNRVYYTYTNTQGCVARDSLDIEVNLAPRVELGSVGDLCENSNRIQIPINYGLGGSFQITPYLNAVGSFDPSKTITSDNKVVYTLTDLNGCTGRDSININVLAKPNATLIKPTTLCANDDPIQINTSTPGTFSSQAYINSTGLFSPSIAGIGNHKVIYSVTDNNNCTNSDSITVDVEALPDATITQPSSLCQNDNLFTIETSSPGGVFRSETYVDATGQFDPTAANLGLNKVVYTIASANGCVNSDSINVIVNATPVQTIQMNSNEGCEMFDLQLNTEDNESITWKIDDQTYTSAQINVNLPVGKHSISLTAINADGCRAALDTAVTVHPNPIADFQISENQVYISNPEVTLYDMSEGSVTSWYWELGDNGTETLKDFNYVYADTGNYTITLNVVDQNGCTDSETKGVEVLAEFIAFFPTAFTPNDDGKNDVFKPVGLSIESMTFQLFNKWGQMLVNDNNFTQWDGRVNGELLTNGTYLYQVKFVDKKGRFHFKNGTVHLLR